MLTFTVHEPPNPPADRVDRAESLVFIKDGFSLGRRLVRADLADRPPAVVAAARLRRAERRLRGHQAPVRHRCALDRASPCSPSTCSIGFEADTLRRWALERRGWRMLGYGDRQDRRRVRAALLRDVAAEPADHCARARSRGRPAAAGGASAGWSERAPEPSPPMQRLVIINYGSGNLHSAAKAFERAARESEADVAHRGERRSGGRGRRRPHRAAGRRRLRRLQGGRSTRWPGMREALETSVREQGPAVPRHLRRRAADGRARAGVPHHAGASAGSRAT